MKLDSFEMQTLKEVTHSPWLYILTFIAAVWAFILFGAVSSIIAATFFALLLSALTLIDFRHMILPDIITIPAILLGLIIAPLFLNIHWVDSLLGAVLGYGFFYIVSAMFRSVKGYDGMGIGDIKLLSMLGAWCGAFALPLIVLGSSLFGVIFFMLRKGCEGTSTSTPMPYGPFLALSAWVVLLYGHSFWLKIFQWRESFTTLVLGE